MERMWIKVANQDKFINSNFIVSIEERRDGLYVKMADGLVYKCCDDRLNKLCDNIRSEYYESNNR